MSSHRPVVLPQAGRVAGSTPQPILHCNGETTWRGGEAQVLLLAQRLHERVATAVACVEGAPLWERCRAAGIPVHALPAGSGLRAILGLRRICRAIDPVCLHAHTSRTHQLARLCAGSRPVLVSRRVSFPLRRRWTSAWKYGGVRHFVAVSDAARAGLLGIGIPAERITIISDGIDEQVLDAAQPIDWTSLGLPAAAAVVCNVAALTHDKDHDGLLAAWQGVETRHADAHLVIAGSGPCAPALQARIAALGLRRVHLLGFRSDVPALLRGAQVFVMNSVHEGLCSAILEAQRCALPVVATRTGGIPEIVRDGIDGRLIAVGDHAALTQALVDLLGDAPRRQQWGAAGRQASDRFSARAMAEAHLALYRRVLGSDFPAPLAAPGSPT